MNRRYRVALFCLAGLLLLVGLVFQGCELLHVSIDQRIDRFETHLNTEDREAIFTDHFHSDADQAWASAAVWEASQFATANRDFTIATTSTDNGNGTATATGTMTHDNGGNFSIVIHLKEMMTGWYIYQIYLDGGQVI